jgi:hypothetical protein
MLRIILTLAVLGFFLPSMAVSMGGVLGKVIEKETQKPIPFAEIILENKMDKIEVRANEYGYYYAEHVPTGKYQVRVVFNDRTFLMNLVRVFDSYSSEVNLVLSNDKSLPAIVELERGEPALTSISPTGISLSANSFDQPTRSLGEVLSAQPGVDVINGKIFIKGSDQVRVFIDGSPVMGQPIVGWSW